MPAWWLTTARLGFRTWRADDRELARGLWGDPEVTALIGGPWTDAQVMARLEAEIELEAEHGFQYWPIFRLGTGDHVGCAGLRPRPEPAVLELGFHLKRSHWGQGYAREAAAAAIEHAFGRLGAAALFAGHHPLNRASARVLESLGFRHTHDELYPPTGLRHPSYRLEAADHATRRPGAAAS